MQSQTVRIQLTFVTAAALLFAAPAGGGLLSDWGLFRGHLGAEQTGWIDSSYHGGQAAAGSYAAACPCGCGGQLHGPAVAPLRGGAAGGFMPAYGMGAAPGYHHSAAYYPAVFGGGYPPVSGGWCDAPGGAYTNFGDTCCGPPWYDLMAEAVFLKRGGDDNVIFTSQGIRGLGPPNAVLSLDDLDQTYEPGYRISGRFQLSAVHNIEGTYLGGLSWSERRQVASDNDDLYSVFSDFGTDPFGGFESTDQASFALLAVDTELDSVECNYRRSWTAPKYRLNGSCLIGARYVRLEDKLRYATVVLPHFDPINMVDRDAGSAVYNVVADNDLIGAQIGFQLNLCACPGLLLCGEAKSGVYGNKAKQRSTFVSTTLDPGLAETASDDSASYISDIRAYFLWQFHPLFKLRGGYEFMYLHEVATAGRNFNAQPPFGSVLRTVDLDDHADIYFHGFNFGLEFGW